MGLDLQTCIFTFRQIKAAIDDFNPANRIGEDGSGSIYKVQYYSIILHNHSCDSIYLSSGIEDLQIIKTNSVLVLISGNIIESCCCCSKVQVLLARNA